MDFWEVGATPRSSSSSKAVAKAATIDGPVGSSLPNYGPSSSMIFDHPDSDDSIAQTLYKTDDKVRMPYSWRRSSGREGEST